MNSFFKLILIYILSCSFAVCTAQNEFEKGLAYFNKRAEKHKGLKVDSVNINNAIKHFTVAVKDKDLKEQTLEYLLFSYYYKAAFVVRSKKEQKKTYYIGNRLGEQAIKAYPNNKAILTWYIANYIKYGEAQGIVAATKNGLADNIKSLAEHLLSLDPKFANGIPNRILGVINYKVPNIPLFLTWPSKQEAEKHLKKALAVNPKATSNLYYYAEFLVEEKRYSEAEVFIDRLLQTKPRKTHYIEDLYDITMGEKLKKRLK